VAYYAAWAVSENTDEAELAAAGVRAGTIRLSVGIEDVEDLIWDLEQGFARARSGGAGAAKVPS